MLDREPFGQLEQELVNGLPQIDALEEIWVREVGTQLTRGYPIMRIYLAVCSMDPEVRHLAEQIQQAFEARHYWDKVEFQWHLMPHGRIPKDLPSRVWKRPARVWTPREHRIELARRPTIALGRGRNR
jgi:hypothetical protein